MTNNRKIDNEVANKKSNLELRFFVDPSTAKKLINLWKKHSNFKMKEYSFTDFYFKSERSGKKMVKIRKWKIPKFKPEAIFFERKNGVKSESRKHFGSFRSAAKYLEDLGYEPYLTISKEKVFIFTNGKDKKDSVVIEKIKELGWSGEIEIPKEEKHLLKEKINLLKQVGVESFTLNSLLDVLEQKRGLKKLKQPKMYRFRLLKL